MATLLNFFGWKTQMKAAPHPVEGNQTRQLPPYNVVLINDQQHTYDYVVQMVRAIFGYPEERGFQIAAEVDKTGRAIVCTTHRELAELRREQVHAYGADQRIATCQGSMSAIIEPAA